MITDQKLIAELDEAEVKAWDALSRYKFQMFGYWAAIWVHLNRISGEKRPNPWKPLVLAARKNPSNIGLHATEQPCLFTQDSY
jgi:hypothetical protein